MLSYLKPPNTARVNFSMNVFKLSHLATNLILFSLLFWGAGMGQETWVEVALTPGLPVSIS